jgi:hypothetical protein
MSEVPINILDLLSSISEILIQVNVECGVVIIELLLERFAGFLIFPLLMVSEHWFQHLIGLEELLDLVCFFLPLNVHLYLLRSEQELSDFKLMDLAHVLPNFSALFSFRIANECFNLIANLSGSFAQVTLILHFECAWYVVRKFEREG